MENEKTSYNEATLSGGLVQLEKKSYQSQDGNKDYYQVGIKVNYKDKEDKVQSTYYNAVIPDKHKSMAESLKIGDNVSAKGFITKDEFQDGEIKHVRDKIILTQIDKLTEEKNEAKIKFTGVVVKEDAVVKQVENLGKTASLTVSQSVIDNKTDEKSYIYMEGKAIGKFADKLDGLKKGDVVQMEGALKLDKYDSRDKTTKYEKMNIIVFDAKKIEKEKAETVSKIQEKVSAAPTEEKPKKASKGR
jgi:single-stranded DNA-binding protein